MRTVHLQDAEDDTFLKMFANQLRSAPDSCYGEGASVIKHPPLGGYRTRDRERCSVSRKKAQLPPVDSSDDAESSGGERSSSSLILSARDRHVGNKIRAPKTARDCESDKEQLTTRRYTHSTLADSCD